MRDRFAYTIHLWPVTEEGRCSCGQEKCRRPGKHPSSAAPGPGYAVVTGEETGVFVVDVDVKGGVDGYAQLEGLGELPDTFTVRTSSGGAHFYFKHPGFRVFNKKPASAIDIKGDKDASDGLVYVVGPESPGYVKTSDPCVVVPGDPYDVVSDLPIADAPEWLLSWLRIGETRTEGFAPEPIDENHVDWDYRVALAIEACKTMAPSQADGEGGKRLFALGLRLVRGYELPIEKALELIEEHFNPRCTYPDGTPFPWSTDDLLHKLEDVRDRSNVPTGIPSRATTEGIRALALHGIPPYKREDSAVLATELAQPDAPARAKRKVPNPSHRYSIEIGNLATSAAADAVNLNDIIQRFSSGSYWAGCWQYDEFADQILCVDPPMKLDAEKQGLSVDDLSVLRSYLEHVGMLAREPDIQKAVRVASRSLSFHPVKEYLESLPEGDPAIFDGLAKTLFGTDEPKADEFFRKFLVSSVRRTLKPGTQVDTVLVLYGPQQGEGKTTFVEALFEEKWTRRGLPADLANRDASHALLGYRCVELGELASLLRTEKNAAKDFISWREDVYRQYGNGERVRKQRECVFFGTTNDDDFLRDAGGNRRFWVISVPEGHEIPTAWVREHRDQIWAAALTLAKDATFRHWFTREEEKEVNATREAYQEIDAWHESVSDYCKGKELVRAEDIYMVALGGEKKTFGRRELLRITDTLKRLGCKSKLFKGIGKRWIVPEALRNARVEARTPAEITKAASLRGRN
jgi:predicted P-loop ATPase